MKLKIEFQSCSIGLEAQLIPSGQRFEIPKGSTLVRPTEGFRGNFRLAPIIRRLANVLWT